MLQVHKNQSNIVIKKIKTKSVDVQNLVDKTYQFLDDSKAEAIIKIDLRSKSAIADYIIIASGQSQRFLYSLADKLSDFFKENGISPVNIEGKNASDWVLVDASPIIIHLFKPETRDIYCLEKMWDENFKIKN